MSTTISMYFGIAFVLLGVTAVLLQAWLWNPRFWDEDRAKSHAPPLWMLVHRIIGYLFLIIYVFMMWNMVPRLWQYQVELPARTVIHMVAAITLGVLLITKISILRWFRHFEESMPKLGLGVLLCTVVLFSLSIPFAARAHGFGGEAFSADNLARVERIVNGLDLDVSTEQIMSREGFSRGRDVLVTKCTRCHDMRTILAKPRTGKGWHRVSQRMTEKPSVFGDPIGADDVPYVAAYMIAITPEIQESHKAANQQRREQERRGADLAGLTGGDEVAPEAPQPADDATGEPTDGPIAPDPTAADEPAGEPEADGKVEPGPQPGPRPKPRPNKPAPLDPARGKRLLQAKCTECHEIDEVVDHGGDTLRGWSKIVRTMVSEEGAELTRGEASVIARFLAQEYPPK